MKESSGADDRAVRIEAGGALLDADINIPPHPLGMVVFAHGSGSSRHSSRNRAVARELNASGLATLLMDLLTSEEESLDNRTRHLRFDIEMLTYRLVGATHWINANAATSRLPIGLFGASTGGGAALVAAATEPHLIRAVVSRGGRPDLAGAALPKVQSPTLLIVGGDDVPVIRMNRDAMARMQAPAHLEIVPHATHLFEEPGALEEVAELARDFFTRHLD